MTEYFTEVTLKSEIDQKLLENFQDAINGEQKRCWWQGDTVKPEAAIERNLTICSYAIYHWYLSYLI